MCSSQLLMVLTLWYFGVLQVNKVYLWSYKNTDGVLEPNQISQQTVPSDVTDMMFMKCNMLLVTLANGSVLLMNTDNEVKFICLRKSESRPHL